MLLASVKLLIVKRNKLYPHLRGRQRLADMSRVHTQSCWAEVSVPDWSRQFCMKARQASASLIEHMLAPEPWQVSPVSDIHDDKDFCISRLLPDLHVAVGDCLHLCP